MLRNKIDFCLVVLKPRISQHGFKRHLNCSEISDFFSEAPEKKVRSSSIENTSVTQEIQDRTFFCLLIPALQYYGYPIQHDIVALNVRMRNFSY
ncbi:unnamed protein product [Bursaphelenchus xylophilus]|uniref:(pine wood nematode) hypothetical protein n=1 Tax=Bursaphelenchus xylophilus TaxID=6326 RepID=A0A7I8XC12_BURXY|nr:unnamed protein product [Bursaphelenchus xylophilus]CAG9131427.1 unnamed protein product [Bursaphelenchus xylophilus]